MPACSTSGAPTAGLEYDIEKPARRTRTLVGPQARGRRPRSRRRSLPGLAKKLSAVALGFEDFRTFSSGAILLDAFCEAGGNLFDTAFVYGAGYTEKLFGDWHTSRGVRDRAVLIGKGAHTPLCYPDVIGKQLDPVARSAEDRLRRRLLHAPRQSRRAGRRVRRCDGCRGEEGPHPRHLRRLELDARAHRRGDRLCEARPASRRPARSPTTSRWPRCWTPIWPGCVVVSDDDWKAWLKASQIPNFAWSSQGRGFFTDRAGRDKRDNEELVRVWYSEKNFGRRDRAIELAEEARQEPDPRGARLCACAALPGRPADRSAHACRSSTTASRPSHQADAGAGALAGRALTAIRARGKVDSSESHTARTRWLPTLARRSASHLRLYTGRTGQCAIKFNGKWPATDNPATRRTRAAQNSA